MSDPVLDDPATSAALPSVLDAGELVRPLLGALVPVPAVPQGGVCTTCHSSANPGHARCVPCEEASHLDPPQILPITLSLHGGVVHDHLRGYKDGRSSAARDRMGMRLAGLVATFVANHAGCIGEWDDVTCIPSASRVAFEPVVRRVPFVASSYREMLVAHPGAGQPDTGERASDPLRFAVTGDVAGRRVLLLDDTFTTGATLFAATAALRSHGAAVVGPVVVGRHVQPSWPPSRALLSWLVGRRWDPTCCARCAGEIRAGEIRAGQLGVDGHGADEHEADGYEAGEPREGRLF